MPSLVLPYVTKSSQDGSTNLAIFESAVPPTLQTHSERRPPFPRSSSNAQPASTVNASRVQSLTTLSREHPCDQHEHSEPLHPRKNRQQIYGGASRNSSDQPDTDDDDLRLIEARQRLLAQVDWARLGHSRQTQAKRAKKSNHQDLVKRRRQMIGESKRFDNHNDHRAPSQRVALLRTLHRQPEKHDDIRVLVGSQALASQTPQPYSYLHGPASRSAGRSADTLQTTEHLSSMHHASHQMQDIPGPRTHTVGNEDLSQDDRSHLQHDDTIVLDAEATLTPSTRDRDCFDRALQRLQVAAQHHLGSPNDRSSAIGASDTLARDASSKANGSETRPFNHEDCQTGTREGGIQLSPESRFRQFFQTSSELPTSPSPMKFNQGLNDTRLNELKFVKSSEDRIEHNPYTLDVPHEPQHDQEKAERLWRDLLSCHSATSSQTTQTDYLGFLTGTIELPDRDEPPEASVSNNATMNSSRFDALHTQRPASQDSLGRSTFVQNSPSASLRQITELVQQHNQAPPTSRVKKDDVDMIWKRFVFGDASSDNLKTMCDTASNSMNPTGATMLVQNDNEATADHSRGSICGLGPYDAIYISSDASSETTSSPDIPAASKGNNPPSTSRFDSELSSLQEDDSSSIEKKTNAATWTPTEVQEFSSADGSGHSSGHVQPSLTSLRDGTPFNFHIRD